MTGCNGRSNAVGPNGGDLVSIKGGTAYAELLTNADSGEVMIHTWGKDLKSRQPIEEAPIPVGSGENIVALTPHSMDSDPAGTCSRFYGEANWLRGGSGGEHKEFVWQNCWQAESNAWPYVD